MTIATTPAFSGTWNVVARDVTTATPGTPLAIASNVGGGQNGVYDLSFATSGDLVTYTVGYLGRKSAYVADLRNGAPRLTSLGASFRGDRSRPLTWSPDGRRVDWVTEPTADSFQFTHHVATIGAGGLTTTISQDVGDYARVWSPDGNRLAFTSADDRTIYFVDGNALRSFALPGTLRLWNLITWTPDSSAFVFTARDDVATRLYALVPSASGADLLLLTGDVDVAAYTATTSPDGGSVAVLGGGRLYVADLRSPQLTQAVAVAGPATSYATWSPDSQRMAFAPTGTDWSAAAAADRDALDRLTPLPFGATSRVNTAVIWSPDGAWATVGTDAGVLGIPSSGGPVAALTTTSASWSDFDWLAAERLVYLDGGVSLVDLAAAPPRTPLKLDPQSGYLAVAHERQAIFYYRFGDGTTTSSKLWMVDAAGATPSPPVELADFAAGIVHFVVSDPAFVGTD